MQPSSFAASGVVALLTDFGLADAYVGQLKGVVLARAPRASFVDLTHEVPPQDVRRGAWILARSRAFLPAGTVFVCVVDPGVGSARALLLAIDEGQAFLAPDNGLLSAALSPAASVLELDVQALRTFSKHATSATFHGRDLLAPAAAALLTGVPPARLARALARPHVRLELPRAARDGDAALRAEVLFADHYGNLVLSADERDLAGGSSAWEVEAAGRTIPIRRTYSDAAPGELVALVDSQAALEIAVRGGSAADLLGLASGAGVLLRRRT